jgi:hypothetical protein
MNFEFRISEILGSVSLGSVKSMVLWKVLTVICWPNFCSHKLGHLHASKMQHFLELF